MTRGLLAIVAFGATTTSVARAEPVADLRLAHEPMPTHLHMRPRTAAVTPAEPATPSPLRTPPAPTPPPPTDYEDLVVRDVKQPVSFSVNLGYQVEAAPATRNPTLDNVPIDANSFARLRSYGFGEGFLSTRGIGAASLSTYFAARFQVAADLGVVNPNDPPNALRAKPPPIATWFERSGSELRTGWAELKDFLPDALGLHGLRIRAGDQFVYGPWVIHLDGALAAFENKLVRVQVYGGVRHNDYTRTQTPDYARVGGASARLDLRGLARPVPIAIAFEQLWIGSNIASGTPSSNNQQYEIDWRPAKDFALIGKVRQLDNKPADQRLEFRGRYKQVSNLVFDLVHRSATDWRWDPAFGRVDDTVLTARPYLDLGPVLPQLVASARAGTLIAENVDLYAKAALASDLTPNDQPHSSYNASYVELGGALQVRLRRTISLETSVLSRQTALSKVAPTVDVRGARPGGPESCGMPATPGFPPACQPLPDGSAWGQDGFTEVGTALRLSLGARKLSATVEIYGRKTRYAQLYSDIDPLLTSDLRAGSRFTVEAWVSTRVRLYAAYDVSSRFEFQPEISDYKSLRLVMSGTY